jgi:hypothetical protein
MALIWIYFSSYDEQIGWKIKTMGQYFFLFINYDLVVKLISNPLTKNIDILMFKKKIFHNHYYKKNNIIYPNAP